MSPLRFIKDRILAIGFGVEHIGIVALKAPIITCVFLIVATVLGLYGASIMKVDDRISAFFESERVRYQDYQSYLDKFPASEDDFLLVLHSDKVLNREQLKEIRLFQLDLGFEENIADVYSVFSLRKPDGEGNTLPIVPDPLPKDETVVSSVWSSLQSKDSVSGSLIGADGKAVLLILSFQDSERDISHATVKRMISVSEEFAGEYDLSYEISGAPAIRYEISKTVHDDRIRFNIIGFVVGFFISFMVFRDLRFVAITSVPALLAAVWTVGVLGFLSTPMNMITTVIPAFVMVIAFADATHLVYAIRRRIAKGMTGAEAAVGGIQAIGPACVLTSITTAIAVLSLTLTSSTLIQSFGWAASIGAFFALLAVLITIPVATALLFPNVIDYKIKKSSFEKILIRISEHIANFVLRFATGISVFALVLTVASLLAFAFLDTNYRVKAHIPDNAKSKQGLIYLDNEFGGLHEIIALVESPDQLLDNKDEILNVLSVVTETLLSEPGTSYSNSILNLKGANENLSNEEFESRFGQLPKRIAERLVSSDGRTTAIRARFSLDEKQTIDEYVTQMEKQLASVRAANPEYRIYLSGTSVLTSESDPMLRELRNSLLGAFFVAIAVVGLAFRSMRMFMLSIVPNILPLSLAGVVLLLTGWHFEFASAMALTVAFGIAVDDTIHMLHRLHRELSERGARTIDAVTLAASSTIKRIGPVIILATIILVAGICVSGTSDLPTMRMFGGIATIVLFAALITDVIFLPAMVITLAKMKILKDK